LNWLSKFQYALGEGIYRKKAAVFFPRWKRHRHARGCVCVCHFLVLEYFVLIVNIFIFFGYYHYDLDIFTSSSAYSLVSSSHSFVNESIFMITVWFCGFSCRFVLFSLCFFSVCFCFAISSCCCYCCMQQLARKRKKLSFEVRLGKKPVKNQLNIILRFSNKQTRTHSHTDTNWLAHTHTHTLPRWKSEEAKQKFNGNLLFFCQIQKKNNTCAAFSWDSLGIF